MSIKPIDFQVIIPKTSEVSKINSEVQNKDQVNQHHDKIFMKEQANRNVERVNERQDIQNVAINKKDDRRNYNKGKNKKHKEDEGKDEKQDSKEDRHVLEKNRIDIRI